MIITMAWFLSTDGSFRKLLHVSGKQHEMTNIQAGDMGEVKVCLHNLYLGLKTSHCNKL